MSFPVIVPVARESTLPEWVGPIVVAAVLQAALMVGYMARFDGDPSVFVCAPSGAIGEYPFEHVHASLSKEGHDGQAYYVMARSPFQRQDEQYVSPPCYRHVRILYPALAWAASGGDPKRLLWVMPLINSLAVVGLAGLGALFALRFGRSAWWGLLLPVVLNAATPALRDFTDPLATFCAFALLAAWLLRGHVAVLALAATAAALSREQNVAIVGIVLMASLWRRRWGATAGLLLALAVWGAWVCYLKQLYGVWPYSAENMSAPFGGMLYRWEHLNGDHAARSAPMPSVNCSMRYWGRTPASRDWRRPPPRREGAATRIMSCAAARFCIRTPRCSAPASSSPSRPARSPTLSASS